VPELQAAIDHTQAHLDRLPVREARTAALLNLATQPARA
jgi:hypothetical protein